MKTLTELDCLSCAGTGYNEHIHNEPEACKKCDGDGLNRDITAKDIANYFSMNRFNTEKYSSSNYYIEMLDIINVLLTESLKKYAYAPCENCGGGHIRPCQHCGDSGFHKIMFDWVEVQVLLKESDSHFSMKKHAIEFAEYLTDNHKYCEPDGWKDINGKGETLNINQLYNKFNENKTK